MRIVHIDPCTKYVLTNETKNVETGAPIGFICDRDGATLTRDQQHQHREIYLDTISGTYVMRISHEEMLRHQEDGDVEILQGAGTGIGWFVEAPDYTLNGRHGESEGQKSTEFDARPPAPARVAHRPAKAAKKTASKKAAKKAAARRVAEKTATA